MTVELLVWRDSSHFETRGGEPHLRPCTLCRRPTPTRSHRGEPVHKICAEEWNATHPTELGKGRFVSDDAPRRRVDDEHA